MSVKDELKNLPEPTQTPDDVLGLEEGTVTSEKLKMLLPKGSRVKTDQTTVDLINRMIDESACHKGLMEERLMSHLHLMGPGIGLKQIMKGVQFVTLATTPGMTQSKAYALTFPDKAQEIAERDGDISSFASQYAATKVPTEIMTDIQIGPSITYAPLRHQCVQKYIELMNGKAADGPASATVQLNATVALMDYIQIPEDLTINLKQDMSDDAKSIQQNLADQIQDAVAMQRARMNNGESINNIQKLDIVAEAEVIEDE